jgi:hypothetical protein
MTEMNTDPNQIFLVSGQATEEKVGGRGGLSPAVTQHVVVAEDAAAAYEALARNVKGFQPLGHASLAQYEQAAQKIRAVLAGESTDWPLHRA